MNRTMYNPSYANRGQKLEKDIEASIYYYRHWKMALIQKVPTPIKPVRVDYKRGIIYEAFFDGKSTVDYVGNYQGRMIAFDAKETAIQSLPLQNVEDHQYQYLKMNHELGGISFLMVSFTDTDEVFYLPFDTLEEYWQLARKGIRKSIPYKEFQSRVKPGGLIRLDFLKNIEVSLRGG